MITDPFIFSGYGIALPKVKSDNVVLEKYHNIYSGYIEDNFGIKFRYRVENETAIDLAVQALEKALKKANYTFNDIDLLISASVSIAYQLPNNATIISKRMNERTDIPCFDINLSCLSWLSALDFAVALLQNNTYKRIAIVSAETPSKILNKDVLESQVIFGDAAVATIIEKTDKPDCGKIKGLFKTYSDGWNLSMIPAGGLEKHPLHVELEKKDYTFHMENKRLLLFSLKKIKVFFEEFNREGDNFDHIDKVVPHQGSKAGLDFFINEYAIESKIVRNFETRGNCVAASIPLAFFEAIESGAIKKGNRVLLTGTAAGISVGALLIQI